MVGLEFRGWSFGYEASVSGEAVFQTGMVGYPESLTDPSYCGQILIMTYPLIGNYGVPSTSDVDKNGIPLYMESDRIHVKAMVCCDYSESYSHWNAKESLGDWLVREKVVGIFGVDTRELTKVIRESGTMLGKIVIGSEQSTRVDLIDPNLENLVAKVSTRQVREFAGDVENGPRLLLVDCGMKYAQLRALIKRAGKVVVVSWDYDFGDEDEEGQYDGIFISNGPGDPKMVETTIRHLRQAMKKTTRPIFGICLGHQLLALAAGFETYKLKYGNRGHNQPCVELLTKRCYITSQNHGFAVNTSDDKLVADWAPTYVNANDHTNEGIAHTKHPFFSVQFHPEACAGPSDTHHLFDIFADLACKSKAGCHTPPFLKVVTPAKTEATRNANIKKVMILGSGGLAISQAGEFDYSGSQAIKALKEEGVKVVLINPNIATVQTSRGMADKVYFLPITPDNVKKVARNERPDGVLLTFGGQTALNCGIELYRSNFFQELDIEILGTSVETILDTEDRERFNERLAEINEPFALSQACATVEECVLAAKKIGYPVILRAAFALGGLGSGFANNREETEALASKALSASSQVLVERSMKGWKEIEYEVVRDASDNCITVCNMENFDPLGIHTGDSIVVAPSQTLSDYEYQMLRNCAIRTVRHLGVVGECNIQYALNPNSTEYCIIEVNARLSRSSALASKATGYPLAFVAAKLALGKTLLEIPNSITKETTACFEPSLDYCVVKMPRWDLKKFTRVSRYLGSSMKSVGEVMAIGRNFEEAIQKSLRMARDYYVNGFESDRIQYKVEEMRFPTEERVLAIANGLAKGVSIDIIHRETSIDKWFLYKLQNISQFEAQLRSKKEAGEGGLRRAKELGFSDKQIAKLIDDTETDVRQRRLQAGIVPIVKQIDTVAAEFPAKTNYLYVTYSCSQFRARGGRAHDVSFHDHGTMVLGSGAYHIGSSVEFDWCAVSAVRTLRALGYPSIMVNYNPETVSTDYDECDKLYFEELSFERVLDIYEMESSRGIIVSMGGQIPNNIAMALHRQSARILGTTPEMIDGAENRYKFSRMLDRIKVDQPLWKELSSIPDAMVFCKSVGYPVLVRPSYVLSGAAMNVVHKPEDLELYLTEAATVSQDCPVVISKFILEAKEIEVDAVARKGELVMHVVSEHVENAGVHSGDATVILPPQDLSDTTMEKVQIASRKIAHALNITGPMNIQFIAKDDEIKVIECNLRASRTFPFISKTISYDLAKLATKVILGLSVRPYPVDPAATPFVGVKVPQFSFTRLLGADPILGVEMASTGEVACYGENPAAAFLKGLQATDKPPPAKTIGLSIGSYKEKLEFLSSARVLHSLKFTIYASPGTADFLVSHQIPCTVAVWPTVEFSESESLNNIANLLKTKQIEFLINIPSINKYRRRADFDSPGFLTRRTAVDHGVPLLTNIKCAKLFVKGLAELFMQSHKQALGPYDARFSSRVIVFPGLTLINMKLENNMTWTDASSNALRGGFTFMGVSKNGLTRPSEFSSLCISAKHSSYCDYGVYVSAKAGNATVVKELANRALGLLIAPSEEEWSGNDALSSWMVHFSTWSSESPILIDASGKDLAALMYGAIVCSRDFHVHEVRRKVDMDIVRGAKQKGLRVTCDVNVLDLYANPLSKRISQTDQEALWESIDIIDCICGPPEHVLSLLLGSVEEGRLSLDWVQSRLVSGPRRILGLGDEATTIEVDLSDKWKLTDSPEIEHRQLCGMVRRVVAGDSRILLLDGKIIGAKGNGKCISNQPELTKSTASATLNERIVPTYVADDDIELNAQSQTRLKSQLPSVRSASSLSARNSSASSDLASNHKMPNGTSSLARSGENQAMNGRRTSYKSLTAYPQKNVPPQSPGSSAFLPGYGSGWWAGRHILKVSQFNREELHALFGVAQEMRSMVSRVGNYDLLRGKVMACLFYEPSTRTSCSFQAAMHRLGGTVLNIQDSTSSIYKGETLEDSVRTLQCYSDVMVLRHSQVGAARKAASYATQPIINAGDGAGEHPTQAILDVFTIREELGTVNGLTITFVGDLKYGRTVHSLARLICKYAVKIRYVSPDSLRMPSDVLECVASQGVEQSEHSNLDDVLRETDVLYVTRIQKERFKGSDNYESVKNSYIITPKTLTRAKENMIIMHPLPRVNEISPDVDSDPRAVYFRQMEHGMYVRMALLAMVLGKV